MYVWQCYYKGGIWLFLFQIGNHDLRNGEIIIFGRIYVRWGHIHGHESSKTYFLEYLALAVSCTTFPSKINLKDGISEFLCISNIEQKLWKVQKVQKLVWSIDAYDR